MSGPTPDQIHTLQHSLGIDRDRREPWRNYYCDEERAPALEALVACGLMFRGAAINGGEDRYYHVTEAGRAVAVAALPEPERLTRSQARYRRFLRSDAGMTFREFIRAEAALAVAGGGMTGRHGEP